MLSERRSRQPAVEEAVRRDPMSPSAFSVLLLAAVALSLTACGSATEPDEDPITPQEADALVQELYGGSLLAYGGLLLQADPAMLTVIPPGAPLPVEAAAPCDGGGEATFSGSVTIAVNEADASIELGLSGTLTPRGCTLTGDGATLVLNGDPGLAQEGTVRISLDDFSFSIDIASSGSFKWTSGTRSGGCTLENTIAAQISMVDVALVGAVPTATVTGSVCGLSVNREIALASLAS